VARCAATTDGDRAAEEAIAGASDTFGAGLRFYRELHDGEAQQKGPRPRLGLVRVRTSPHIEIITARLMAFIGDETALLRARLPLKEWSSIMRHLFKQTEPLQDRIASFSREVKAKASRLPPGKEKDNLFRRARLADMASQLDDWANSPGLQPPK
jgi:hypothetical protein